MSIEKCLSEEDFFHYYQPIYSLQGSEKIGFEALFRSNTIVNPGEAFNQAKQENRLFELDTQSIYKAILTFHEEGLSSKDSKLFLNLLPSTVSDPNFPDFLEQLKMDKRMDNEKIIFEITESEFIEDYEKFKLHMKELKSLGFSIALDDVGQGYSNTKAIIELEPDFIKLDRYYAHNLHRSKQKQAFISFFLQYCEQFEIQLILEGIENEEELAKAESLGILNAQGYLLGRPNFLRKVA